VFDGHGTRCLGCGALNFDSAAVEVEVGDLEAERFADAQAGEREEADE